MSGPDDYPVEMCDPQALDERTIEALLAGRTVPGDGGVLAEFAQSVRAFTHQPAPAARGELAALIENGLTIDKGDRLVTAASHA